jgi:hypothetical protein
MLWILYNTTYDISMFESRNALMRAAAQNQDGGTWYFTSAMFGEEIRLDFFKAV